MSFSDMRSAALVWIVNSPHSADAAVREAQAELDRRLPRTASLCYDTKKGWEPISEIDRP